MAFVRVLRIELLHAQQCLHGIPCKHFCGDELFPAVRLIGTDPDHGNTHARECLKETRPDRCEGAIVASVTEYRLDTLDEAHDQFLAICIRTPKIRRKKESRNFDRWPDNRSIGACSDRESVPVVCVDEPVAAEHLLLAVHDTKVYDDGGMGVVRVDLVAVRVGVLTVLDRPDPGALFPKRRQDPSVGSIDERTGHETGAGVGGVENFHGGLLPWLVIVGRKTSHGPKKGGAKHLHSLKNNILKLYNYCTVCQYP